MISSPARFSIAALMGAACLQVGLGVSTLLSFVWTPIAAAHQAGSLSLLTCALWMMHVLRRVK